MLDLSSDSIELLEATWKIRFVPVLRFGELQDQVADAFDPYRKHIRQAHLVDGQLPQERPPCESCDTLVATASKALLPVYCELVRWGLVETSAPGLTLPRERVLLDGRTYEVLTEEFVDRLAHIGRNADLVRALGDFILGANRLDPRTALGFK